MRVGRIGAFPARRAAVREAERCGREVERSQRREAVGTPVEIVAERIAVRDGLVGIDDPFEREREKVAIEHRLHARRQVVFGVERPLGDGSSVGVGRLLAAGGIGIRVVIIVRPSAQNASVVFALLDNLLRKLHPTHVDGIVGVTICIFIVVVG